MNTINIHLAGPFQVETSQPEYPGASTYHGILDDTGAEVGRIHAGDDADAAKKLAQLMAAAPDLLRTLQQVFTAFNDVPLTQARPDRTVAIATAETLIKELSV